MFDQLTSRLGEVFKRLKNRGRLTEADVSAAMREVRLALLEADVNYKVVKELVGRIKEQAVGEKVLGSITPAQQVMRIVHQELTRLMGEQNQGLDLGGRKPAVIMLVGLQGSGKTTTAGKLALMLTRKGKRVMLVPADTRRPAAIEQLKRLGTMAGVEVAEAEAGGDVVEICREALRVGARKAMEVLVVDTAGRLQVDEQLMAELVQLKQVLEPREVLLVADAMTGQEAVNIAQAFHEALGLTGVVLTKVEGDARGGAALSIRAVVGVAVKFVGVGEKLDALEAFHPERMAGRILGMGDVLTLAEKAAQALEEDQAKQLARKFASDEFTLEDFREQLRAIRRMGSLESILGMLPGMGRLKGLKVDEKELIHAEAIINSMTPQERRKPQIIDASRRRRIARGSGTTVADVNRLLNNYNQLRRMMKQLRRGGGKRKALARLLWSA